jgi:hypothetical protein
MRTLNLRLVVLVVPMAFVLVMNAIGGQKITDQEKAARLAAIRSLPRSEVNSISLDGTPIQIQTATAREVSKATFRQLTGEASRFRSMSTYPDVTVVNVSQKTITSIMIMIKSSADAPYGSHGLMTKDMSMAPGATYTFESVKWPKADKVFVEKDGKFISVLRQPGLDSAKSWLPGVASDLTVAIVNVVFEDGTQWTVPSGFKF